MTAQGVMLQITSNNIGHFKNKNSLFSAYTGRFCEEDRDGCSEIQCYVETDCRDVPAPGVGAECGPCPSGFTGQDEKCLGMRCIMCI